jgi:hypothetical protein
VVTRQVSSQLDTGWRLWADLHILRLETSTVYVRIREQLNGDRAR